MHASSPSGSPTEPSCRNHELFREVAERTHARTVELDGLGHWWMLQDPGRGARVLEGFWDSLA